MAPAVATARLSYRDRSYLSQSLMLASFTKPMKFVCHSGLRCVALLEFGEEAFYAPALLTDDSRSFFPPLS
jgi:hypothetical protein